MSSALHSVAQEGNTMISLDDLAAEFSEVYGIDPEISRGTVSIRTDSMIDDPKLYEYIDGQDERLTEAGATLLRQQMSDLHGSGSVSVDAARAEVRRSAKRVDDSLERRDANIRAALTMDVPVKDIVADTGLSRARVYQIRDGRR